MPKILTWIYYLIFVFQTKTDKIRNNTIETCRKIRHESDERVLMIEINTKYFLYEL